MGHDSFKHIEKSGIFLLSIKAHFYLIVSSGHQSGILIKFNPYGSSKYLGIQSFESGSNFVILG